MTLIDWVIAARPKTLTASWMPVVLGVVIAYKMEVKFDLYFFACTFMASIFVQVATNYINDAIDFKKGADTKERLGPKRMTAEGKIKPETMLKAGFVCLAIAAFLGLQLVFHAGVGILLIGVLSVFLAYAYTAGPFPLAYIGLSDIFVLLFFGVIAVVGSFYVQALSLHKLAVVAGLQIGFLAVVLLAINNFRDMEQDKIANKKTLAVRFGAKFMRLEILFCLLAPYLLLYFWYNTGFLKAAILPVLSLPLAIYIFIQIYKTKPSEKYNKLLAKAGLLHMFFGLLLTLGILLR
ncbi:MAG: 1,4-dihydroxy-2-naphthoate octaprenyltransferase [Oligoflexia bacterium]|nr:1,4-dihydroxy-2-naphthoate octaprenyltransferase [Oligoflexia bacterium]